MAKKKASAKSNTHKSAKKSTVKTAAKKVVKKQARAGKPASSKTAKKTVKAASKKNSTAKSKSSGVSRKINKTKVDSKGKAQNTKRPKGTEANTEPLKPSEALPRNQSSYDMLRQDIIATLWKYEEINRDDLMEVLQNIHGKNFISDSLDFVQSVVDELLRIDLIELFTKEEGISLFRIRQRLSENN